MAAEHEALAKGVTVSVGWTLDQWILIRKPLWGKETTNKQKKTPMVTWEIFSLPQILSFGRMNKIKPTQKGLCTSIRCYYKPSSEQSKGCKWEVFTWIIISCPASHRSIKYKTFQSHYWNQECRKQAGEWLIWNVKHLKGCWFSELVSWWAVSGCSSAETPKQDFLQPAPLPGPWGHFRCHFSSAASTSCF